MWQVVGGLLIALMVVVGVAVVAAVFLGLGTLLSGWFPVAAFEATVVLLAVAGVFLWAVTRPEEAAEVAEEPEEEEPEERDMKFWVAPVPLPTRSRKKHRR